MAFFNFRKKYENIAYDCCLAKNEEKKQNIRNNIFSVKVLWPGCKNCHTLLCATKEALENLELNIEVEYITDMKTIMDFGVINMPVLVINDDISSEGKVLKVKEVEKLLGNYLS